MSRRPLVTVVVAAALTALAACGQSSDTASSETSTAPPTSITPSSGLPEDRDGATVTPTTSTTSPTVDDASRTSAADVAETVMTLWVRQDLPAEAWFDDLRPHLSDAAAQDMIGTDPASGAPIKITGKPKVLDQESAFIARVHLMTNQGTYLVLLSRAGEGDPWLVERITPPEVVGH